LALIPRLFYFFSFILVDGLPNLKLYLAKWSCLAPSVKLGLLVFVFFIWFWASSSFSLFLFLMISFFSFFFAQHAQPFRISTCPQLLFRHFWYFHLSLRIILYNPHTCPPPQYGLWSKLGFFWKKIFIKLNGNLQKKFFKYCEIIIKYDLSSSQMHAFNIGKFCSHPLWLIGHEK